MINSAKTVEKDAPKAQFLHKNTDKSNNNENTVTVKLCESSADDTKVQATKYVLSQEKVVLMWRESFVIVFTAFFIPVTKYPSSRVVLIQCSGDVVHPTRKLWQQGQLLLDAHGC